MMPPQIPIPSSTPSVVGGGLKAPVTPPNLQQVPGGSGPGFGQIAMMALQDPQIQAALQGVLGGQQQQQQQPMLQHAPRARPQWRPPIQAAPIAPLQSLFG